MKANWKTTATGLGTILVAIGAALKMISEGNIGEAVSVFLAGVLPGIGLLFAKDAPKAEEKPE